jgi:hypothetical protein
MASIFGTGLDEVIRHVPSLKPLCITALVDALKNIIGVGEALVSEEIAAQGTSPQVGDPLINKRTAFLQYVNNFSNLLEQILARQDHASPFIAAGGVDLLIGMYK